MITNWTDIKGQEHVKRAAEVAIAGGHHILMTGPPGQGKTLIAESIPGPGILLGVIDVEKAQEDHHFISPHPTISDEDLFGCASKPGEITLAHYGILFLDDLPEFGERTLRMLHRPLENKVITFGTRTYPANFTLVATMTPCPCGLYGNPEKECVCLIEEVKDYQETIPGPFWDRIDVHVEVPRIPFEKLISKRPGESSEKVRERVKAARAIQRERFGGTPLLTNSDMGLVEIKEFCSLDKSGAALLEAAMVKLGLSARAYHRIIKLSRTVADLAGSEDIRTEHVAEAIQYRPKKLIKYNLKTS